MTDLSGRRNPKFEWQTAFLASGLRPSSCITVGMAIADHWNGDTPPPFASLPYLHKTTGLSVSTIQRALRVLRTEGWIAQGRRGGRRGDQVLASTWRLTVPNPSAAEFPTGHSCHPNRSLLTPQQVTIDHPVDPSLDPVSRPPTARVGLSGVLSICSNEHPLGDPNCPWC